MVETVNKTSIKRNWTKGDIITINKLGSGPWVGLVNAVNRMAGSSQEIKGSYTKPDGSTSNTHFALGISKENGDLKKCLTEDEQLMLEDELGYEKGYLSFKPKKTSEGKEFLFWRDYSFVMQGSSARIDTSEPMGYLNVCLLESISIVLKVGEDTSANSKAEYQLISEKQKVEKSIESGTAKKEAYKLVDKFTTDDRRSILSMLGRGVSGLSDEALEAAIYREIEVSPRKIVALYNNSKFKTMSLVTNWLEKGAITKKGKQFYFANTLLGIDIDSTIKFIESKENADIVTGIKAEYEERLK